MITLLVCTERSFSLSPINSTQTLGHIQSSKKDFKMASLLAILPLLSLPLKIHGIVLKRNLKLSEYIWPWMNQPIQQTFNLSIGKRKAVLKEELLHFSVPLSEPLCWALKAFYGQDGAEVRQAKSRKKNKGGKVRTKVLHRFYIMLVYKKT